MAYSNYQDFLQGLRAETLSRGLDASLFDTALKDQPEPIKKAIKKSKNQPEFSYTFNRYLKSMHAASRVNGGFKQLKDHALPLAAAEEKYGVPKEVITSLWGVESLYGKLMGDFPILPSLATLAYQSHRKQFFREEFFRALKIVGEGHIGLEDFKGSWAGAMGQCQFMPSSFLNYATDGDGDGRKDIWQTPADVVASAANYLKRRGWKEGESWGQRIVLTKYLPGDMKFNRHQLSQPTSVTAWQALGVIPTTGQKLPVGATQARLFLPEGPSQKAYLVYNNFNVIMKWNISSAFAFSVLTLADKFKEGQPS
ncbi:MAG: lytic murein transglycosylase [Alphaproteobacteria bacterium]|nr:lytic murein transglycosylase [Alphaproteobacteria bacterium]